MFKNFPSQNQLNNSLFLFFFPYYLPLRKWGLTSWWWRSKSLRKKTMSVWQLPRVFKENIMNQMLGNHQDAIPCNMLSDDPVRAGIWTRITHSVKAKSHVLSVSEQLWLHLQQIFGDLIDYQKTRSCSWAQYSLVTLSSECHLSASWPMKCYPASSPKIDSCVGVINARELPEVGEP